MKTRTAAIAVEAAKHISYINKAGRQTRPTCKHSLIPGLDAQFCRICQIWWIDSQMTEQLLNKGK